MLRGHLHLHRNEGAELDVSREGDTSPSLFLSIPAQYTRKKPDVATDLTSRCGLVNLGRVLTLESPFPCLQNGIRILCYISLKKFWEG